MSLNGKLEFHIGVRASPSKFLEMFRKRPHHVTNASGDKVQDCKLHKGEWGKAGSIISWHYFHDGKAKVDKQVIEAVDEHKNVIVFRMIEGGLLEGHRTFKITVEATPKGEGSVVHWTLEYEKLEENVREPYSMLEFFVGLSKDIDAHLMEGN